MKKFLLTTLATLFLLLPVSTMAQQCLPRHIIVQQLQELKVSEQQVFVGFMNDTTVFEIFANRETGTWTAFTTQADGSSCLKAAGQNMAIIKIEPPEEPSY